LRYGRTYLEATQRAIQKDRRGNADASAILRHAKAISRVQPLIRRITQNMHKKEFESTSPKARRDDANILSRMSEVLSASSSYGRFGTRKRYVLRATIRELLKQYNAEPLLIQFYNYASDLASKECKDQAKLLFSLLSDSTVQSYPELCGKSHYKLALLALKKKTKVRHLTQCTQFYPQHRAARELLANLQALEPREPCISETSTVRQEVVAYCQGNGVDIGYGGDPVVPTAITIDQPPPYTPHLGSQPQNLMGDGADLRWFKDNSLDYVYSSHLIEDFEETAPVLKEWLRVLKPGGYMVLVAPVEKIYREHCWRSPIVSKSNWI
jgi:hypothetical protein